MNLVIHLSLECVQRCVQILRDIFPVVTYSNLVATAVLPFAVSGVGVKACSLVAALARVATRILLIFGSTVSSIQISEVGIAQATLASPLLTYAIYCN